MELVKSQAFSVNSNLPLNSSENYTPWGSNGIKLTEAPTSSEAIKQAGLDWDVELRPCHYYTDDGEPISVPNKKVVVRNFDNRPLSVVGNKWKPIQNVDAFNFFDPFVEKGLCKYDTAGFINNGEKIWIMAKINADPMEIVKGDLIDSYFLLTNAHNAISCARAIFTDIRLFCTNVLHKIEKSKKQSKIYHMGDTKSALQGVSDLIDMRREDFKSTVEQYQFLASKSAKKEDTDNYIDMVFNNGVWQFNEKGERIQVKEDQSEHKRAKRAVEELIETGRGADTKGVKGTWWGNFNAVTEYLDHYKGRKVDTRLNSIFYGDGRKKSIKALDLALNFANVA